MHWVVAGAVLCVPGAVDGYRDVIRIGSIDKYVPMRTHAIGVQIARVCDRGYVLTLAPIYPLEGGAKIYAQFASGPFAWRIAPFVAEAEEEQLKMPDADDLDALIRDHPPSAVLLSSEDQLDIPLRGYARRNGVPLLSVSKSSELSPNPAIYGTAR